MIKGETNGKTGMDSIQARAPRLFWITAVFSLVWNAFGAYDYVMTNIRDAAYLANFPPETVQYLDAMPYWTIGAWALGVWGALAGSMLLLVRSRFAKYLFGLSLLGLAASTFYQFGSDMPEAMKTAGMNAMILIIWIVAVLLLLYSFRWHREGILR